MHEFVSETTTAQVHLRPYNPLPGQGCVYYVRCAQPTCQSVHSCTHSFVDPRNDLTCPSLVALHCTCLANAILDLFCPQDNDSHPHYDALKRLLASGRPIAVKLDLLAQLESRHAAAKGWVDRAARTFIKKNSTSSLLEVSCVLCRV